MGKLNKLTLTITWPEESASTAKIGEAICDSFKGADFRDNILFCNYTDIQNEVVADAHLEKVENASSYIKVLNAVTRTLTAICSSNSKD